MIDQGFDLPIEPLEYSDEMRLSYDDPVTFAQSSGHGFFTVDVERVSSVDELDVEHPEVIGPTDDWLAARDSCEARHPYPLIKDLAGVGVSNMAYELHGPSRTLGHNRRRRVGPRRGETRRVPQPVGVRRCPGTSIISDTGLAELVDFERAVYEIDTACGEESGRYEAERVIDRQVIDTIRAETGYDGVHLEPAT